MRRYTSAAKMPLWKWILCLIGGLAIFLLLYGLCQGLPDMLGLGMALRCVFYVVTALLALLLYTIWTNLTERRPVEELALRRALPDTGKGLLTGAGFFCVVVGILALVGCYRVTGVQFDTTVQVTAFLRFLMGAVFEEILFRGIVFRLIDDRWNTVAALIISALIFGAIHFANTGATLWSSAAIAIEAGLMLGAAYKFSRTLWLPIGIHWAWNYVQGNVFGFAVSGSNAGSHIFSPIISGPNLVTGGVFGAEASIITVGVGLILTIVFLMAAPRERRY